MIKVLFVCHGNICRSPMAEFIFKDMLQKEKLSYKVEVASRATSTEEIGSPVYPKGRKDKETSGICRQQGRYKRSVVYKKIRCDV